MSQDKYTENKLQQPKIYYYLGRYSTLFDSSHTLMGAYLIPRVIQPITEVTTREKIHHIYAESTAMRICTNSQMSYNLI